MGAPTMLVVMSDPAVRIAQERHRLDALRLGRLRAEVHEEEPAGAVAGSAGRWASRGRAE